MKFILWLKVLILLFIFDTNAQYQSMTFNRLDNELGLAHNSVYVVFQDSKGFMWFGTADGLNRYDGYSFKLYKNIPFNQNSITQNRISAICEDREGRIWIGTHGGGVNCIDQRNDKITSFTQEEYPKLLKSNIIRTFKYFKSGILWIGTDKGLARIDTKSQKLLPVKLKHSTDSVVTTASINAIEYLGNKKLWLGTWGKGIYSYSINKQEEKLLQNSKGKIKTMCFVGDELWAGTYHHDILVYSTKKEEFINYPGLEKITGHIFDIFEDSKNNIWIGTFNSGLYRFDKYSQQVNNYIQDSKHLGITPGKWIPSITEDRTGLLWVGSEQGVYIGNVSGSRFDYEKIIKTEDNDDLPGKNINAIFEDSEGTSWIGTWRGGLYTKRKDALEYTHHTLKGSQSIISNDKIWDITQLGNRIYIGTGKGISVVDVKTHQLIECLTGDNVPGLSHNNISAIELFNDSLLVIGTWGKGVCICNPELKEVEFINETKDAFVNCIYTSNDTCLIGTVEGMFCYTPNKIKLYKHQEGNLNSLPNNNISAIRKYQNEIWIGMHGGGIAMLDTQTGNFTNFSDSTTLLDNSIYALEIDYARKIWTSGSKGIMSFSPKNKQVRYFSKLDGVVENSFASGSIVDKNNYIIFGTATGIIKFHPDNIYINKNPPLIEITHIEINGSSVNIHRKVKDSVLVLTPEDYMLTIEFAALDYGNPQKNEYQYKLVGFDNEWLSPRNTRTAIYTNLPYGDYSLRIKASNNDGVWNENDYRLKIKVLPPFYKTTWFISIVIIALLLLGYSAYKIRTRNLRKSKRILEKKVKERTKTLEAQKQTIEKVSKELKIHNETLTTQGKEIKEKNEALKKNQVLLEEALSGLQDQKRLLENKNNEITSGLHYAKHIQDALLPEKDNFDHLFPNNLLIYLPRDIVSGDFFWLHSISNKSGKNCDYVAAVDCTGHGVPGALMSILSYGLLGNAIGEYSLEEPAKILDFVHDGVIKTLKKERYNIAREGMDISICRFEKIDDYKTKMTFAGAYHSIYIVREKYRDRLKESGLSMDGSGHVLYEVKGDKLSVGNPLSKTPYFTQVSFNLNQGDRVFMFSDGFIDQFGGPKNKKFLSSNFKKLLLDNAEMKMNELQKHLLSVHNDWKKDKRQLDDILILGIEL